MSVLLWIVSAAGWLALAVCLIYLAQVCWALTKEEWNE